MTFCYTKNDEDNPKHYGKVWCCEFDKQMWKKHKLALNDRL